MADVTVMPWAEREFLIYLTSFPDIPEQIGFGRYYETSCDIALESGEIIQQNCVIHRPANMRSTVGEPITDWLLLLIRTDLTSTQLSRAAFSIGQDCIALSEAEARARWTRG
ncbi:hypothetical protein FHT87_003727 [Rhizobium sp. BK316]|uniref:hypothetical protein n=1 Tax=Rhizobium sp. BK316 TaxID=2587053 RepID=UPI00160BFE8B|nr:hypothetical protein [Rhizobium sp. BK316]MBB3409808.1 hypothetical protein [Rhizobium sp. BK316]